MQNVIFLHVAYGPWLVAKMADSDERGKAWDFTNTVVNLYSLAAMVVPVSLSASFNLICVIYTAASLLFHVRVHA